MSYPDSGAPEALRRAGHAAAEPTYYGQPAIRRPEWLWYIPAYFFLGGLAAGAYIVSALLDAVGGEEDRSLVRAGRLISVTSLAVCPLLLIADLGRPERFVNMLRVLRPRSVMNLGTWGLTVFGAFAGLAGLAAVAGWRSGVVRALLWLGLLPAAFVGSYTGVLLSATNVPLWAANRLLLGPLFFASALSSGLAATRLAAELTGRVTPSARTRLDRAERISMSAELVLSAASILILKRLARPLYAGRWGLTHVVGAIGLGMIAPLALPRRAAPLSAVLALIGSLLLRFCWTEAGKLSADDPIAYFAYTSDGS